MQLDQDTVKGVLPDIAQLLLRQFRIRSGPDGILLFDRRMGVNILIEELRLSRELWHMAPRHVSIALTNACDLNCYHCFAPKHPARLDMERLVAWLDELDATGCISVGFGGGEPTLYKNLPDVCRHVTQNTGMAVTFTTHGHHIDEQLAATLKGNVHFIRVSMDGVGATYEKIRKRSFSSLLQKLEIIREITPFGINYLVNDLTFPEIDTAVALAYEAGASEFLLLPEVPANNTTGIDKSTTQALRRWVNSYDGPIPLTVSEVCRDGMPIADPLPKETGVRAYAHIDASGVLKRSSYGKHGIPIGPEGVMKALELLKSIEGNIK